jgi:hypothetical protein
VLLWPCEALQLPIATSHSFTADADGLLAVGADATEVTLTLWPWSVASQLPVAASHSVTVLAAGNVLAVGADGNGAHSVAVVQRGICAAGRRQLRGAATTADK